MASQVLFAAVCLIPCRLFIFCDGVLSLPINCRARSVIQQFPAYYACAVDANVARAAELTHHKCIMSQFRGSLNFNSHHPFQFTQCCLVAQTSDVFGTDNYRHYVVGRKSTSQLTDFVNCNTML